MIGTLVISKAGHDTGSLYVIIGEEDDAVWLADGRLRPAKKPKRKNKRHIQVIKHFSAEAAELLAKAKEQGFRNEDVKRVIREVNNACQKQT